MKVLDIVIKSAELLNQNDVVEVLTDYRKQLNSGEDPNPLSGDILLKTRKLIATLNLVSERICSEYITIKAREEMVSGNDFSIKFCELMYPIHEVLKVTDCLTKNDVDFEVFPTFLSLPTAGRRYLIEYRYRPNFISEINDEIVLPIFITERALCFGIVSDTLLTRNIFDEAKVWNDKFVEAINHIKTQIRERKF